MMTICGDDSNKAYSCETDYTNVIKITKMMEAMKLVILMILILFMMKVAEMSVRILFTTQKQSPTKAKYLPSNSAPPTPTIISDIGRSAA